MVVVLQMRQVEQVVISRVSVKDWTLAGWRLLALLEHPDLAS